MRATTDDDKKDNEKDDYNNYDKEDEEEVDEEEADEEEADEEADDGEDGRRTTRERQWCARSGSTGAGQQPFDTCPHSPIFFIHFISLYTPSPPSIIK